LRRHSIDIQLGSTGFQSFFPCFFAVGAVRPNHTTHKTQKIECIENCLPHYPNQIKVFSCFVLLAQNEWTNIWFFPLDFSLSENMTLSGCCCGCC
jgi:hypothetical protein